MGKIAAAVVATPHKQGHVRQGTGVQAGLCLSMCVCGLLLCRTAEGRKCRLGEGGFGVVYKAVMNGVDEVAVKLVKVRPSAHTCTRI